MPWHIEQRDERYCVIPDDGGDPAGCHDTREEAEAQIAALYANEPEAAEKALGVDECTCPACGAIVEHKRGTPCAEVACPECAAMMAPGEKAGRRVRGDKVGLLGELKAAWDKFWSWATYEDREEPPDMAQPTGMKLYTGRDGQTYLLIWTTNAFRDREGETFATKAIEDYVERHKGDGQKGKFDFWHVPGSEFGTITTQAVVGRFLVEAGVFDDSEIAQAFKAFFQRHPNGHSALAAEGWGASHQFAYHAQDRRPDGTFESFEKTRTTVLPLAAAANPWTKAEVIMAMSAQQKAAFDLIGREVGVPDLAEKIESEGEERTKELELAGVAHKSADLPVEEPPAEEPEVVVAAPIEEAAPEPEPPPVIDEKAVAAAVIEAVGPLVEQVKALTDALAGERQAREALASELAELRTDEAQRIKAVVETTPAASLASMITAGLNLPARAVGSEEARIDGRKARGPKETPADKGTGIELIDALISGTDWRDILPSRA